jgi:hypothetical protein
VESREFAGSIAICARPVADVHDWENNNRRVRWTVMNDVVGNEGVLLVEVVATCIQVALEPREVAA